jgi:putative ABC transport system permease protein
MSKKNREHPSSLAEAMLSTLLTEREKHDLLGDYAEYYREISDHKGRFIANLWYWMQIANLIPKTIWNSTKWRFIMFKNYLKIAFRNLRKHKGFTFINMFGLAVGMACVIFILLYVDFELSYDNYHDHADRIYRIVNEQTTSNGLSYHAGVTSPLGPAVKENLPQVENMTRILRSQSKKESFLPIRRSLKCFLLDGSRVI